MIARKAWTRMLIGVVAPGLLMANGCAAALEVGLDRILAPDAIENAIALPLSPLLPLARFFLTAL